MDNQDNNKNFDYKEFEERFNKFQEQRKEDRFQELEEQFPKEERILRLEQLRTEEKAIKDLEELNKYDAGVCIDTSKFHPLNSQDLIRILGLTIKKDDVNKLITFLAQLSIYTEDSQLNISFNAPSSSGKSFIPLEISYLFPTEDVIKLGSCSPTAFFHEQGEFDKEKNIIKVDLSRKILIFMDQPNSELLKRLRSLLSHDEKEIQSKITDKNQKGGNRTKTVIIKGFPAVVFCSASLAYDEQESTRFLLLSPELNQDKIRQAIHEKIRKSVDGLAYRHELENNPDRQALIERILAIKAEHIGEINICSLELMEQKFFDRAKVLKPRYQRDITRIMNLAKLFALINLWFRERNGFSVTANEEDIEEAFKVWDVISESQELNLPPYVFNLYKDVIVPVYQEKNSEVTSGVGVGLTREEIMQRHYKTYNRFLPDWQLRQQIIPPLETAGLITQEQDPTNKRRMLIYPTLAINKSQTDEYSELDSGVSNNVNDKDKPGDLFSQAKSIFGIGVEKEESGTNENTI